MGIRSRRLVVLIMSLPALLFVPPAAQAAFPGINGRLAFAEFGIFTIASDGTTITKLAFVGNDTEPAWSPDASRIAWEAGDNELWVMNANGTGQRQLPTEAPGCIYVQAPSWAPDGERIVFSKQCGQVSNLFVIDADGTGLVRLSTTDASFPSWSPDGTRIAYYFNGEIWVMKSDGTQPVAVVTTGDSRDVGWSPDSQDLIFSGDNGDTYRRIYVVSAAGGTPVPVTDDTLSHDQSPTWSPDGTKIAFTDSEQLTIVDADGSNRTEIAPGVRAGTPDWGVACTKNCSPPPPDCLSGDAICGGDDAETLRGTSGDDAIYAGAGNDTILAGGGNDDLWGDDGSDSVQGQGGADFLRGGGGRDVLTGGPGSDRFDGGPGRDKCVIDKRRERRRLKSCEVVRFRRPHG